MGPQKCRRWHPAALIMLGRVTHRRLFQQHQALKLPILQLVPHEQMAQGFWWQKILKLNQLMI